MSTLRADRGARATNPVTVVDMVDTRQTPVVSDTSQVSPFGKTGIVRVCRAKHNIHLRQFFPRPEFPERRQGYFRKGGYLTTSIFTALSSICSSNVAAE